MILFIVLFCRRGSEDPGDYPPVVLVTVLEDRDSAGEEVRIIDKIIENRWEYANAHGMLAS